MGQAWGPAGRGPELLLNTDRCTVFLLHEAKRHPRRVLLGAGSSSVCRQQAQPRRRTGSGADLHGRLTGHHGCLLLRGCVCGESRQRQRSEGLCRSGASHSCSRHVPPQGTLCEGRGPGMCCASAVELTHCLTMVRGPQKPVPRPFRNCLSVIQRDRVADY